MFLLSYEAHRNLNESSFARLVRHPLVRRRSYEEGKYREERWPKCLRLACKSEGLTDKLFLLGTDSVLPVAQLRFARQFSVMRDPNVSSSSSVWRQSLSQLLF